MSHSEILNRTQAEHCLAAINTGRPMMPAAREHEQVVRAAVRAGKIVSGRALADYPSLQFIAAEEARNRTPDVASSLTLGGGDNITPKQRAEHDAIGRLVGAMGGGPAGSGH